MSALAIDPSHGQRVAAYAAILRVWLRRIRYLGPLLVLLMVGIVALVASVGGARHVLAAVQFCTLACLVCLWAGFFATVLRQNHPLCARLLPGQLRALRELALIGFLVTLLPSAWLLAASPLQWPGPAALILAAMGGLLLAVIVRWPWMWIAGWGLVSAAGAAFPAWSPEARKARLVEIYNDQPVSMAAFLLVMVALALWHLFQSGGPGHVKSWARRARVREMLDAQSHGTGSTGSSASSTSSTHWAAHLLDMLGRRRTWLRDLWMRRLIRDARPAPRSVLARAELVSSPQMHWTAVIGLLILVAAGVAAAWAVVSLVSAQAVTLDPVVPQVFAFTYLSMLANPVFANANALWRRRREQALLLLVPGMPRGQALNRQLALRQMITHALNWALAVVIMLGLQALFRVLHGGETVQPFLSRTALGFAATALPMGVLYWRNWASQSEVTPMAMVLLTTVVTTCIGALSIALGSYPGLPSVLVLGGSVVVTLGLMALRWPAINRYPSFWPVGRDA